MSMRRTRTLMRWLNRPPPQKMTARNRASLFTKELPGLQHKPRATPPRWVSQPCGQRRRRSTLLPSSPYRTARSSTLLREGPGPRQRGSPATPTSPRPPWLTKHRARASPPYLSLARRFRGTNPLLLPRLPPTRIFSQFSLARRSQIRPRNHIPSTHLAHSLASALPSDPTPTRSFAMRASSPAHPGPRTVSPSPSRLVAILRAAFPPSFRRPWGTLSSIEC